MSITTKLSKAKRCPKQERKIYMIYEKMKVLKEGNHSKIKRSHTGAYEEGQTVLERVWPWFGQCHQPNAGVPP